MTAGLERTTTAPQIKPRKAPPLAAGDNQSTSLPSSRLVLVNGVFNALSVFTGTHLICAGLRLQKQQPWKHPAGAAEHAASGK